MRSRDGGFCPAYVTYGGVRCGTWGTPKRCAWPADIPSDKMDEIYLLDAVAENSRAVAWFKSND